MLKSPSHGLEENNIFSEIFENNVIYSDQSNACLDKKQTSINYQSLVDHYLIKSYLKFPRSILEKNELLLKDFIKQLELDQPEYVDAVPIICEFIKENYYNHVGEEQHLTYSKFKLLKSGSNYEQCQVPTNCIYAEFESNNQGCSRIEMKSDLFDHDHTFIKVFNYRFQALLPHQRKQLLDDPTFQEKTEAFVRQLKKDGIINEYYVEKQVDAFINGMLGIVKCEPVGHQYTIHPVRTDLYEDYDHDGDHGCKTCNIM